MNNFAKKSMPNVPVALAFVALGFVAFVPGNRRTQNEEPNVLHACYIPHIGLVYRIKEPGLRSECRRRHVEFSWNEKGPRGDPGPPGPSNGGGLTRTVFQGTCMPNAAVGVGTIGEPNDGAVISDLSITVADPPIISAYIREPGFHPIGTFQTHSYGDDLFIQDGKIIIECSAAFTDEFGTVFPAWDYRIVIIK